jgi:hypothetical protein
MRRGHAEYEADECHEPDGIFGRAYRVRPGAGWVAGCGSDGQSDGASQRLSENDSPRVGKMRQRQIASSAAMPGRADTDTDVVMCY